MNSGTLPGPLLDDDDPALFHKLTDDQIELLARHGTTRATQVGDVLFRDGDPTYDVMVVLEGRVSVMFGGGDAARELAIQGPRDLEEFRALLGRELVFGDFVLQTLFRSGLLRSITRVAGTIPEVVPATLGAQIRNEMSAGGTCQETRAELFGEKQKIPLSSITRAKVNSERLCLRIWIGSRSRRFHQRRASPLLWASLRSPVPT